MGRRWTAIYSFKLIHAKKYWFSFDSFMLILKLIFSHEFHYSKLIIVGNYLYYLWNFNLQLESDLFMIQYDTLLMLGTCRIRIVCWCFCQICAIYSSHHYIKGNHFIYIKQVLSRNYCLLLSFLKYRFIKIFFY